MLSIRHSRLELILLEDSLYLYVCTMPSESTYMFIKHVRVTIDCHRSACVNYFISICCCCCIHYYDRMGKCVSICLFMQVCKQFLISELCYYCFHIQMFIYWRFHVGIIHFHVQLIGLDI